MKGASVPTSPKPAKLETGLVVAGARPFITEGEKIRVNTAEALPGNARRAPPGMPVRSTTRLPMVAARRASEPRPQGASFFLFDR